MAAVLAAAVRPAAAQALLGALDILSSSAWLHRSYCSTAATCLAVQAAQAVSSSLSGSAPQVVHQQGQQHPENPCTGAAMGTASAQGCPAASIKVVQWQNRLFTTSAVARQPVEQYKEQRQQHLGQQQHTNTDCQRVRLQKEQSMAWPSTDGLQSSMHPFARLGVHAALLPALMRQHIQAPSPVQAASIGHIMAGSNVALQSQTGSGKTLAYLLPLMSMLLRTAPGLAAGQWRRQLKGVQVLVVAPSQELCMQIMRVAQSLLPNEARAAVQQCIGGANPKRQKEALAEYKPLVVVGTPGRLVQLISAGDLKVAHVPTLVLDEADQLLSRELHEDMCTIHSAVGTGLHAQRSRQTVIVSASLQPSSLRQLSAWCPAPKVVSASTMQGRNGSSAAPAVAASVQEQNDAMAEPHAAAGNRIDHPQLLSPHVRHFYILSYAVHKVDTLRRCMHALGAERALVFMNWQQRLKDAQFKLEARGMEAGVLHGGLPKAARQGMLAAFSSGKLQALVVSDMAARGLDVEGCDAVFNLELPETALQYAHRAGRTGRMGTPGVVVSVVTRPQVAQLQAIGRRLAVAFEEAFVKHGQFMIRDRTIG